MLQERQIEKLEEMCEGMKVSCEQAEHQINELSEENRRIITAFESERLKLEKMHLEEVSRLHKAVK